MIRRVRLYARLMRRWPHWVYLYVLPRQRGVRAIVGNVRAFWKREWGR